MNSSRSRRLIAHFAFAISTGLVTTGLVACASPPEQTQPVGRTQQRWAIIPDEPGLVNTLDQSTIRLRVVYPDGSSILDPQHRDDLSAISNAADQWGDAALAGTGRSTPPVEFVGPEENSDGTISINDPNEGSDRGGASVHFDDDGRPVMQIAPMTNPEPNEMRSTVLHEMGHMFGLDDGYKADDPNQCNGAHSQMCDWSIGQLTPDDLAGAKSSFENRERTPENPISAHSDDYVPPRTSNDDSAQKPASGNDGDGANSAASKGSNSGGNGNGNSGGNANGGGNAGNENSGGNDSQSGDGNSSEDGNGGESADNGGNSNTGKNGGNNNGGNNNTGNNGGNNNTGNNGGNNNTGNNGGNNNGGNGNNSGNANNGTENNAESPLFGAGAKALRSVHCVYEKGFTPAARDRRP